MRFAQAHKTTSYLTMAAALCAMASGGGLGPVVTLVAVLGLAGSWFWEAPRVDVARWAWVFTIVAVLAMVWAAFMAVTTGDYLGAGGGFLALVTVARACTRRAARDWQQLYLLSFLMLVAGSVLNSDLTYALCFLAFVITATWTLILFHLRREMEDNFLLKHADPRASERVEINRILASKRIVDRRFFVGTGLVSLGVFVLASAMFLAIPRIGVGFFFRGKGGLNLVGFSDGVKLGGHGRLKRDTTIVMRVAVGDPRRRGRKAPAVYWRGSAFDLYQRGQWTHSRRAPGSQLRVERLTKTRERRYWPWPSREYGDGYLDQLREASVYQDIYLEPIGADVLFAASSPVAVEIDVPFRGRRPSSDRNDEVRLRHEGPLHYRAWSQLDAPPPAALAAAPTTMRRDYEVYLQLPPEITPRTRALAEQITAGATSHYERANRIRDWLIASMEYSLDLVDPGKREPIDFFLFERKAGHCEYFASAFAVLARSVGVPTRNVNGFLGGEWNEYEGYIAVRAGDAHSWNEVFFPGQGWVTYDATPPGVADELGRGGSGWRAKLRRWFDSLRFQWNKWVIDYDLYQQLELFRSIGQRFSGGARSMKAMATAVKRWIVRHAVVLSVVTGLGLVALGLWLRRRRRRRWPPGMARARARARSELAGLYDRAARRLARRGYRRDPAVTPRELAKDLVARGVDGAVELAELTELYYAAEWGGSATDAMVARARALAAAIEQAVARAHAA
jgi:transglutaminase-like putative cysteine protease